MAINEEGLSRRAGDAGAEEGVCKALHGNVEKVRRTVRSCLHAVARGKAHAAQGADRSDVNQLPETVRETAVLAIKAQKEAKSKISVDAPYLVSRMVGEFQM